MNTLLTVFAWLSMVLSITAVLLVPLLMGQQRTGKYGYADFISKLLGAIMTTMLAMRVLGWI